MYECWKRAPYVYLLEISDERGALGRNERDREYHYFTSCKCRCRKFKVPAGHWQAWTSSELRCVNHSSCAFLKKWVKTWKSRGCVFFQWIRYFVRRAVVVLVFWKAASLSGYLASADVHSWSVLTFTQRRWRCVTSPLFLHCSPSSLSTLTISPVYME